MANNIVSIPWSSDGNDNSQPTSDISQPSETQVTKKRKQKAIMRPEDDVFLLKEAVAVFPWGMPCSKRTAAWETIVNTVNQSIDPERYLDVRRAHERIKMLLERDNTNEMNSLRASGTEEDFSERTQLLTDLSELFHDNEMSEKEANLDREEEERQGEFLRKSAMEGMRQNSDVDSKISGEGSKRVKLVLKKQKLRINKMEQRLEAFIEDERSICEHEITVLERAHILEETRQELENRRLALEERRHEDQQRQISQLMALVARNLQQ